MKLLYDGHIFRWETTGGIRRYFTEVIARLPEAWDPVVFGVERGTSNLPGHPRLKAAYLSALRPRRFSQPIKNQYWRRRHFASAKLLHPTYYRLSGGLQLAEIKCPIVATIHDFIHAAFPHQIGDAESTIRLQRDLILRADHLICISTATKRDLLDRFPNLEGKTSVISLGTSFPVTKDPPIAHVFHQPTFLFVGRRSGYKNFLFLLRAFAKVCQSQPHIRLQLAGPPLAEEERWQIHFLGIEDRIDVAVFPDERALQHYYQECLALLYPSRHEGFGIPPLEAMACGTVAVTANTTSLPEVVGDGGLLLDPNSESDWAEVMLQLAAGTIKRSEIIERARARAALFSWEKTAREHTEIYQQFT